VDRLQRDYLGATRKFEERYRKGIGVSEENRLGNIKEGLLKNKSPKGDPGRAIAELLGVVSFAVGRESVLLLLSSCRPCSTSFYSLE